MRAALAILLAWCTVAGATPKPKTPKPPPPPEAAEIKKLEQELAELQAKRATFAAAKVARKLYELDKKLHGEDGLETQRRKMSLASLLMQNGAYAEAEQLDKDLVTAAERASGPQSNEVKNALQMLNSVYLSQMHYDDAEPTARRMLEIERGLSGDRSDGYANQLSMLQTVLWLKTEYSGATQLGEEVLKLREARAKAPDDPQLLAALQSLGQLYWMSNQRPKAILLFDRVIAAESKSTNLSAAGMTINGIASTYHYTGREDLAAPLRKRVEDLYVKEIARLEKEKPDDYAIAQMTGMLGFNYRQVDDWPNAEKWLDKAIALDEKKSQFSGWYSTLAEVKRAQGKPREALALLEKAETALVKISPDASATYKPLIADVLRELGDYKRATMLLDAYRKGVLARYGAKHTFYGATELNLAMIYMQAGDPAKAEPLLGESLELGEGELQLVLKNGTEADHAVYFTQHANVLDTAINFDLKFAPTSPSAARLALTTLLRRKGRVLDAAAASLATIRKRLSSDDKKLLDELASARTQLAKLTVAGPQATGDDYVKEVAALESQISKLELQVGKKSAAYRVVTQRIELASVQKMIPKDARLVEIVNYQPYGDGKTYNPDPKATAPRHYAAFVVGATGDPVAIELGDAAAIDTAVESFRKAVANPQNAKVMDLGKALYDLTMGKIAPKLGGSTNVLIAPDGTLNVIPFSALVDGNQEFLVAHYTFTYLTSGRDLLRVNAKAKKDGGGVIFADPAFDGGSSGSGSAAESRSGVKAGDAKSGGSSRGARSIELSSLLWPALPGTGQEADAVDKTMRGFKVFRGPFATETAVKELHGPRILHLATHGFFLTDEAKPKSAAAPGQTETYENPLLRSGLAFAGANNLSSGSDDGILTALEASGLDLEGTKLVVLSACETGVGKVTNGEGVYGLRRALVIAGAESIVMSLWQVDDQATKELMASYYGHLKQGRGKSSALRDTQLEMVKRKEYAHPYYWASFLPAGDNSSL